MAALRPLLSCRRSFVLNDLAVISAESIALFVDWISFPRKARLSALYLLNALEASCLASLLILSLSYVDVGGKNLVLVTHWLVYQS